MRRITTALVALMLIASGTLFAQLGTEFQVNTTTADYQDDAYLDVAPDNSFVVVWESYGQDGNESGIIGRRFDSTGSPLSSEFIVNTFTTGYQLDPRVGFDGSGNFVVVWMSYPQDGSGDGVFGQRFTSAGVKTGSEFRVNTTTAGYQTDPDLAVNADGSFVVVWESDAQDGDDLGVFGQRFSAGGGLVGSEFQVNQYTTDAQHDASVASDGAGNFVVVWESRGDGDVDGIFARRYDASGTPLGSQFQVNQYTTDTQEDPEIAMAPDGRFVIVWESNGQDGSDETTVARLFNADGSAAGSEFISNTFTTDEQENGRVSMADSGDFVVVWESYAQDGDANGAFGQRYDAVGNRVGSEFRVNTFTTSDQQAPDVGAFSDGRFVVAWESYAAQDGDGSGIFAAIDDRSALSANLIVTKEASGGTRVGEEITYTITVESTGPADATGVTVVDTLPPNVGFISAEGSQGAACTESAGEVTCNLGTILAGNTATVTIVVEALAAGETTNTVVADSAETDPTPADSADDHTFEIGAAAGSSLPAEVPAVSWAGLLAMSLLLAVAGLVFLRRM